ncbi:UDP-N-acetylmuramoyl-tripeptide--D-alanyl-D-alanine ligase [Bathymodiolus septemdierum thioautotrophic gill symbiont]|uniref:UDP-N-acetylmuramoyl-tripeptide--D-alanyl-D-alanine ligase n=1 Tax=endosymbiont of Bathymodiolus septemdierum str. Myojin knoll TaxID=1303921 RepID=A0A0P0UQE9_9GAMM|nr:UDP-N-acetylmuramoyl-tripeptide--D-alanyl-D-alanine ligase [Bathymodiolus septemdierum thioautotrophic gill symbiont]BAS67276.1 UDP-N-acetylmuramoyl-tripeptide--D-alanyl-D-alanine ligase [endosymbiont of Bathymodiolus septemdierum str. Myojin knoll]
MLKTTTCTLAKILKTECSVDVAVTGIYTDTRKRMDGGVFVALVGENFDAHDYVEKAQEMGAVAVVVHHSVVVDLPSLVVADTQVAFTQIARWNLERLKPKVVAITGSNGKTTTKNMLKNILKLKAPTLATKGNLNNHLGVPMTLLKLEEKHQYAVIEMGANHLEEIAYLRDMVNPDIALVTNTLDAHIGEFGGFENLVKAKGEIYASHSQNIVNTQTGFTGDISFGEGGDIFASEINNNQFCLTIFNEKITVNLPLLGRHNIDNALSASACAAALGVNIATIKQGLENTQAEKGRLNVIHYDEMTIIDDSYNASPSSSQYALEVLKGFAGEKIAVLGQMAELGDKSEAYHQQVGAFAKSLDIEYLYSYQADYGVQNFDNAEELVATLKQHKNATLLFKGSRVAKLERIIEKICV